MDADSVVKDCERSDFVKLENIALGLTERYWLKRFVSTEFYEVQ